MNIGGFILPCKLYFHHHEVIPISSVIFLTHDSWNGCFILVLELRCSILNDQSSEEWVQYDHDSFLYVWDSKSILFVCVLTAICAGGYLCTDAGSVGNKFSVTSNILPVAARQIWSLVASACASSLAFTGGFTNELCSTNGYSNDAVILFWRGIL